MNIIARLAQALAAAALVAALAVSPAAAAGACRPAVPLPAATQPPNLGVLKLQLLEYKCLGDYDRDFAEVIARARSYVEQRAGEVAKPAIVLDIDETSLSNWPHILVNDFGFISKGTCTFGAAGPEEPCAFHAWVTEARAEAIKPTLELFNAAKARNIAVFFISGRDAASELYVTVKNLFAVGYKDWTRIILRPAGVYPSVAAFKTAARASLAAEGFTIIANIGDQQSDLDGGFAERTFRVPNPFYYIP